jgi:hypothetical protein
LRPKLTFKRLLSLLALLALGGHYAAVRAQPPDTILRLLQPVTGEISATQTEQRWTFDALKGQRISIRMLATSGNLEPSIELTDSAGKVLATGSNGSYRNSTIDSFVVPEAATYGVRATRAKSGESTSGAYSLSLLPGFSFLLINDPTGANSPMRTWRNRNALAQFSEGKLRLQLTSDISYTWTTAEKLGAFKDLYLQVDMHPEPASGYWEGGLLLRGTRRSNVLEFYVFFLNSDSKWKLAYGKSTGLITIQDWTSLPDRVQPDMTIGVMAKGNRLTLFYNAEPLGEVTDDKLADAGVLGVAIGTGRSPNNSTSILFDNIVVTLPADEAASVPVVIPPKLTQWNRAALPILEELRAARVIPSVGKPGFDVSDAFVTNNTESGIVYIPLARSINFSDLIYTADISWESNNEEAACALEFRVADDKNFTIVYLDRKGGYGIRQESDTDGVVVSLYNLSSAIKRENKANNRMTIIAIGNGLIVYINGTLIANINVKQASGMTYIAAYNYKRSSSVCQFKNVWLRAFDR